MVLVTLRMRKQTPGVANAGLHGTDLRENRSGSRELTPGKKDNIIVTHENGHCSTVAARFWQRVELG
jgi:hypothetical protein